MDYKKWDGIGDEVDEDAEDNGFRGLLAMKAAADDIFDRGCCDDSQYAHCLGLYLKICQNLNHRTKESKSLELLVPCQLNVSCCQLMLKQWDHCIDSCQKMLETKPSILTLIQQMRCHYFRACAYFRRNSSPNDKERAIESSTIIQNMILSQHEALAGECFDDYNELHCTIMNTGVHSTSSEHGFSELLRSGRYVEAKRFFSDLLKKLCSVSATTSDGDRTAACELQLNLADAWEGRGMASVGLGEMDEASDAFERAGNIIAELIHDQDEFDGASHGEEAVEVEGARLRHRDKSREMTLLSASASLLSFQRENHPLGSSPIAYESKSAASTGATPDAGRLYKAAALFKKVTLLPAIGGSKSPCDKFCSFVATAGSGQCSAIARDLSASLKKYHAAVAEGIEILSLAASGAIKLNTSKRQQPERSHMLLPDSIDKICMYPTVVAALMLEPPGLCRSIDPSVVFVMVAECYWLQIGILKHMKRWEDVRTLAETAVAYMGSHSDSGKFQIEDRSEHLLRLTVNFLMSLSVSLEHIDCVDMDDVYIVLETLSEKANILENMKSYREACQVYSWCGGILRKQSGIQPFVLDDKVLHTDNHSGAESASRAVDMYGLAANCCRKNIVRCMEALTRSDGSLDSVTHQQQNELVVEVHSSYCDLMQLHLFRGICAPNRGLAQRCLESAHTAREEYARMCYVSDDMKPSLHGKLIEKNENLNNALKSLHGEICFYLAYTYMRSGKIKYAIEEARAAVAAFDSLSLSDHIEADEDVSSEFNKSKRFKLRHAWGLVAVVTCNMAEDDSTMKESQHALRMVRQFDIGPLEDSSSELERLEKVLELNRSSRHGCSDGESVNGSIQAVNSSHARKLLHQNWDAGSGTQTPVNKTSASNAKDKTAVILPKAKPDYNLLAAFFILSIVVTFFLWLSYNMLIVYYFNGNQ